MSTLYTKILYTKIDIFSILRLVSNFKLGGHDFLSKIVFWTHCTFRVVYVCKFNHAFTGWYLFYKKINNAKCVAKTRNEAPVQSARDIKLTEKCISIGLKIERKFLSSPLKLALLGWLLFMYFLYFLYFLYFQTLS